MKGFRAGSFCILLAWSSMPLGGIYKGREGEEDPEMPGDSSLKQKGGS